MQNNVNNRLNSDEKATPSSKKSRQTIYILSGAAFLVLLLLIIFLFRVPKKVSFVLNNNGQMEPISINEDGLIEAPKDPSKYGYDFKGWYLNEKLTIEIKDLSTHKFTESTIIYAKWGLHKYTITYELNGGENHSGNPDYYTIKHELSDDPLDQGLNRDETLASSLELKNPTGQGTFVGWSLTNDKKNPKLIDRIDRVKIAGDLTLYAIWD